MTENSALILSGGGARAAYQVGVLLALGKMIPKGIPLPFPILCGTSAGALNATMLATNAENFTRAVSKLAFVWRHLTPDQIYNIGRWPLASSFTKTLISLFHLHNHEKTLALMDNTPLRELLSNFLDFSKIEEAISQKLLTSLAITAMNYNTGQSTTFYQGLPDLKPWQGNRRIGIREPITVNHLLASSAIPAIFPAQKVRNSYYGDGAIRQKSAIYPAIKMGAQKIFIIGVSGNRSPKQWAKQEKSTIDNHAPTMAQILGQLLNSAFIDNLEDDIYQLELMNELIKDKTPEERAKIALPSQTLTISPSEEINLIAESLFHTLPKNIRVLIKATGGSSLHSSGSAASYLLFTPEYCRALIELGYKDAMWEKDKILDFMEN